MKALKIAGLATYLINDWL